MTTTSLCTNKILSLVSIIFRINKRGLKPHALGIVPGIQLKNSTLNYVYYPIMYK